MELQHQDQFFQKSMKTEEKHGITTSRLSGKLINNFKGDQKKHFQLKK